MTGGQAGGLRMPFFGDRIRIASTLARYPSASGEFTMLEAEFAMACIECPSDACEFESCRREFGYVWRVSRRTAGRSGARPAMSRRVCGLRFGTLAMCVEPIRIRLRRGQTSPLRFQLPSGVFVCRPFDTHSTASPSMGIRLSSISHGRIESRRALSKFTTASRNSRGPRGFPAHPPRMC